MKRLLALLVFLGWCGSAYAQINTVPSTGLNVEYLRKTTYSAAFFGLVPAASATDIICISGSATKTIRVQNIKLSGVAGTLVTTPVVLVSHVSLDTGGTAASTTANPANTIAKRLLSDPTATATLVSYTANPTIVDASPTYLDTQYITLGVSGTSVLPSVTTIFDFGLYTSELQREPSIIANSTRQICVNLNGVSVSSGVLAGSITWTEE
jgi:hypothetical protein